MTFRCIRCILSRPDREGRKEELEFWWVISLFWVVVYMHFIYMWYWCGLACLGVSQWFTSSKPAALERVIVFPDAGLFLSFWGDWCCLGDSFSFQPTQQPWMKKLWGNGGVNSVGPKPTKCGSLRCSQLFHDSHWPFCSLDSASLLSPTQHSQIYTVKSWFTLELAVVLRYWEGGQREKISSGW